MLVERVADKLPPAFGPETRFGAAWLRRAPARIEPRAADAFRVHFFELPTNPILRELAAFPPPAINGAVLGRRVGEFGRVELRGRCVHRLGVRRAGEQYQARDDQRPT